jgi:hypothetical protein
MKASERSGFSYQSLTEIPTMHGSGCFKVVKTIAKGVEIVENDYIDSMIRLG